MSKFLKNVISIIGIILLAIVIILNIEFSSTINASEQINIQTNKILYLVELIIVSGAIYYVCHLIKKNSSKIKKKYIIFGIILFTYAVLQIVWINVRQASPSADQQSVYEIASAMSQNNAKDYIENTGCYGGALDSTVYFERYSQQFSLAFIWSLIFKILGSTNLIIIQYLNIICNVLLALAIFLICEKLQTKYKMNKYLSMTLYFTFITIPLLSTFIYGDLSGMAFAMLGVYFIMKYTEQGKIRYAFYSALLTSIAYMMRMNILIFIIAIIIYLFLDLISKKDKITNILTKVLIILSFIIITIAPASIVKSYFCNKYDLDANKSFPPLGYVVMGLNGDKLSPGMYNYGIANIAYQNIDESRIAYILLLKDRLKYMAEKPYYALEFFEEKNCSMWTETTFSAVRYNLTSSFSKAVDRSQRSR